MTEKLVFTCSGAADVGELADKVARKLRAEKFGGMFCLAAIGAGVPNYLETAKKSQNIVIDGCPVACGKKIFESKNIPATTFTLTELMSVEKGKTALTQDLIDKTVDRIIMAVK